jgi:hypothetical protein
MNSPNKLVSGLSVAVMKIEVRRICSYARMAEWGELSFKVVRLEKAGQEVLARAGNILVARASFDVSVSLFRPAEIELRQGPRVICSSKPEVK